MVKRKKKKKVEEPVPEAAAKEEESFAPTDVFARDGVYGVMALVAAEMSAFVRDIHDARDVFQLFLHGPESTEGSKEG